MKWYREIIQVETRGKGLYSITDQIRGVLNNGGVKQGMCYLFIPHTSASLTINESYDASARLDLEVFLDRLVPEDESWHRHIAEGVDDSPSHMRTMLTLTSLNIPIDEGDLTLATWQGIYLFEHRSHNHRRKVQVRCLNVV
jgi:secondary thiamine-phosphate synthase enzyme